MGRFRKIPVEINAFQFEGVADVMHGVAIVSDGTIGEPDDASWFVIAHETGVIRIRQGDPPSLVVHTQHGPVVADVGDWILRGVEGEIYPCKDVIFRKTYEVA